MSDKARVASIFRETTETMLRYFRGWEKDLPHQGEKGGIRERRVADFLSTYLPQKYGIGTGHIIDRHGHISNQTDIVIYDALNGIALPVDKYYSLFPCESVYAAIEVKSKLTASKSDVEESRGEIYKCTSSTTKLKLLDRGGDLSPIVSAVFAYDTQWRKDQWQNTTMMFYYFGQKYKQKIPEIVLVLDDPSFSLSWYKLEGQHDKDRFSHLFTKNPLMFFLSDLINRLSRTSVAVPDLWDAYGDWITTDKIATIIQSHFYPPINENS
jgi:hypothetical protein